MYSLKDISVVIPTYNRAHDVYLTLKSFKPQISSLNEVIIVDQSNDNFTEKVIKSFRSKKIRYIHFNIPSISLSRNAGIKHLSKTSKIVCFIDDDVILDKNYFKSILEVFNTHPEALAAAAYVPQDKINNPVENLLRKIFLISHHEKGSARILSAYGNTYPPFLNKIISAQWLPGVNMVYKREVFKWQMFDSNLLGYTVAEDIDFSYRLFKSHPGSLFITPEAKLIHRASTAERVPSERMSYINQVDHFYFQFKNLNRRPSQKIIFVWSLSGISLLRILQYLFGFKKNNFLRLKFFFKSLFYCLGNIGKIKRGRVREF